MNFSNKKGELTTTQLVTLIVLIVSFVIILYFFTRLNLGETGDKEICHNSVVLQEKLATAGPLDCRTNYVCVSGGEDCKDFSSTIKREVNPNNKLEINQTISDEMDDCWWMFGEGKVDYIRYSWKPDFLVGVHCAICSVVKFDREYDLSVFDGLNVSADGKISPDKKYLIVTGMREEGNYIKPILIENEKLSELKCAVFDLTKA